MLSEEEYRHAKGRMRKGKRGSERAREKEGKIGRESGGGKSQWDKVRHSNPPVIK